MQGEGARSNLLRGVLFDYDGTLIHIGEAKRSSLKWVAWRLEQLLGKNVEDELTSVEMELELSQSLDRRDWIAEAERRVGVRPGSEVEELVEGYWKVWEAFVRVFPEAACALGAMRNCGLKLGLLTNSDGQLGLKQKRLETGPLPLDLFHGVLVAGDEVPQLKPDPEPFRVLLKELGLEPQDAAYVGDNPRVDVPGAMEAGMYVFLVRSEGLGPPFPDVRFGDLMEVARALRCFSRLPQRIREAFK